MQDDKQNDGQIERDWKKEKETQQQTEKRTII